VLQGIHQPIANRLAYALFQQYTEEELCNEMYDRLHKGRHRCQEGCIKTTKPYTPSTQLEIDHNIESEWNEDEKNDCNEENHSQTQMVDLTTRY
jgi:predicted Ser/Thr protein kinase